MADAHKNLAVSAVATAPSPATSGTSLVVSSGHGTRFPTAPFNATIWPTGSQPDPSNAEIVRVTAISTDTLTITRAQEGTSARTVVVGDQIAATITAKSFTDIENTLGSSANGSFTDVTARFAALRSTVINPAAASIVTIPGISIAGAATTFSFAAGRDYYFPIICRDYLTFDQLIVEPTTATGAGNTARLAIYNADSSWQPTGTLIEDFGTVATDATGVKTIAPAGTTRTLPGGRYVLAMNLSVATTMRYVRGSMNPPLLMPAFGATPHVGTMHAVRANAAFNSSPSTWTVLAGDAAFFYPILMRVTAEG